MMMILKALVFFLPVLPFVTADHNSQGLAEKTWHVSESTLPKPLSDLSAALAPNGLIYIAGGCDAVDGNVFNNATGFLECASLSDSFYSYNPKTGTVVTLPNMPMERYRHASVATSANQIWLVGGRNLTDAQILEIDVFDIASGTWSTIGSLPEDLGTSDNAAFAKNDDVFVAGGYNASYGALTNVLLLTRPSGSAAVVTEQLAPLLEARGDVKAVSDGKTVAYISGGFTHENSYCPSLDTVERYTFSTNTWESLPPLHTGRGDKALALLGGYLYALGGETQVQGLCDLTDPEPGERTVVVDDVEIFRDGNWTILPSIPERRFRFEAVGYDEEHAIYTFGGQKPFNTTCQCYRTTDEILIYIDGIHDDDSSDDESAAPNINNLVSVGVITTFAGVMLFDFF